MSGGKQTGAAVGTAMALFITLGVVAFVRATPDAVPAVSQAKPVWSASKPAPHLAAPTARVAAIDLPSPPVPAPAAPAAPKPLTALKPVPEKQARSLQALRSSPRTPIADTPVSEAAQPAVRAIPGTAGTEASGGGALLRLLEHGLGPRVEIAWPSDAEESERLYDTFGRCFGMRTLVLTASGTLHAGDGPAGLPWRPDLDRDSGFVRQPSGVETRREKMVADDIRARHGVAGDVVRIFPRAVDAAFLGGLAALMGPTYRHARSIRGRYVLSSGRVLVIGLVGDGQSVAGRIDLGRGRCR